MNLLQPSDIPKLDFTHKLYSPADITQADGVAWVFPEVGPNAQMKLIPFKFPPLLDDEIRIDVHYSGVCHSDIHEGRGELKIPHTPVALGHEILGYVSKVGKDVKNFKVGDRVGYGYQRDCCETCEGCKMGNDNLCNGKTFEDYATVFLRWGGYCTAVQQPSKFAFKIPEEIPDELVPNLMCAGITTYAPIARHCTKGMKVGVLGVGGLGHMAVQWASKMGCEVTAFTTKQGDSESEAELKQLGAEKIVDSSDPKAVALLEGQYHVLVDTIPHTGGATQRARYVDLMKGGVGKYVVLELSPTFVLEPVFPLVLKQTAIFGSNIGSRMEMRDMLRFAAKYGVRPKIEMFQYEEFPKVFEYVEHGQPHYRCVVNVKDFAKRMGLGQGGCSETK